MEQIPVNSIDNNSNTIRVNDTNTPIKLTFKYVDGSIINLKDKIDYFYLTKDDDTFYSVTDITFEGDELIFKLPNLIKGLYRVEIRDIEGSIYPADDSLFILLKRSFEEGKESYYTSYREDILNNVEPIIIQHIEQNPDKFRGERGQQGFPGRDGLPGIDGKDGKDGIDGDKGDPGKDGSMSFVDLTPEEKEELRGERGRPGLDGKDGIDGIDGLPGKDGRDGIDGKDGQILNQKIGINNLIELDKLEIFNQGTIENIDFENGTIEITDTNWLVVQKNLYLENKKYAVRVENVENINRTSFGFYVIKDGATVKSINVQPGNNGILDLSTIVPGYYDLRLYYGNTTVIPGVTKIVKPMLVEGDISVLWNHKEKEDVLTSSIKRYIPTDYPDLTTAITDLSRFKTSANVIIELMFETGHQPSRGVSLSNGEYGHFLISSQDDILSVSNNFTGRFLRISNGTIPVLNTIVDMKGLGTDGIRLEGGSKGYAQPRSGCINVGGTGLYVRTSSFQAPYSKFTGCLGRNVWITRGANVSIANSDLSNPLGERVGVYVSRSSILDASECDISGGVAQYANIQVLRSKATLLGATIKDAFNDGVVAANGSQIILRGGDISYAGKNAIRANGSSSIELGDGIKLTNAGENGIHASLNSTVSGSNVNVMSAGKNGVFCKGGSTVTVPGINATNCNGSGIYVTHGGKVIIADDEMLNKSYISFNTDYGIFMNNGSEVICNNVKLASNKKSGVYSVYGNNASFTNTEIISSLDDGIYCSASNIMIRNNSSVKLSGNKDMSVSYGGKIIAHGTPTTSSTGITPFTVDTNISDLSVFTRDGMIMG